MAEKPSKPERTILDAGVSFKRWDTANSIATTLIKWVVLAWIFWTFKDDIGFLAGKITFADIVIRVLGNVKVSRGILALFMGSGWIYGLGERALRRRHIKRVTTTKNDLERLIDANRTSSQLTSKGTTPSQRKKGGS